MDLPPSYEQAMGMLPIEQGSTTLEYIDFVPNYNSHTFKWECFSTLVTHANTWLSKQPGVKVIQCESILTFHSRQLGFNPDRSIFTQSKQALESTQFLRFLRIWYKEVPEALSEERQTISHHNFTPPIHGGSIPDLFETMNSLQIEGSTFPGSVLNVETVQIARNLLGSPDENFWSEVGLRKAEYSFFIRVFVIRSVDPELIRLGFMDFVPRWLSGTIEHQYRTDCENFTSLVSWAQDFMRSTAQEGFHLLNIQSLYVKFKSGMQNYHQRTNFSIISSWQLFNHYSQLKQILRVYYVKSPSKLSIPFTPSLCLSCKSFMPAQMPSEPGKLQFESFSTLCERIRTWVRVSGAQILCIHCVPLKMYRGRMGIVSTDVTYIYSDGPSEDYGDVEHWIHCIRLYIVGSWEEPSPNALPPVPHIHPPWFTLPPPSSFVLQPATRAYPS